MSKKKCLVDSPRREEEIGVCGAAYTTVWRILLPFFAMVARSGEGSDSFEPAGYFFLWYSHVETTVEKKLQLKTALKRVLVLSKILIVRTPIYRTTRRRLQQKRRKTGWAVVQYHQSIE